ncbi:MAG: GNAT family N-acetyltransferase [Motilibacteraceae bacterium]
MTATSQLEIREMLPGDEAQVLALLTASLAGGPTGRREAEFLRWKHQENPFGRSPALVAVEGGTVVGVRFLLRWRLRLGNEDFRAVRMVDTATHPDHQGRGIFKRLTLAALERWADEIDLVFNTPNSNSRPGYLKMGWQEVGALPISLRVRRPLAFARGAVAAARRVPVPPGDLRANGSSAAEVLPGLLDDGHLTPLLGRRPHGLHTPLTPEFLRWRYAEVPGLRYEVFPSRRGGELVGLGIGRRRRRGPLVELTLAELLTKPDDDDARGLVLSAAAKAPGIDHVAVHLPSAPERNAAIRRGYLPIPRQGMVLTVRPGLATPSAGRALSDWSLSLGDLEVF